MNILLLRICSVPIRISSPELHVSDTCFLHELHIMERYVTTTYRLQELHVCIQGGYVCSMYPEYKIDALNIYIKLFSLEFLVCCRRAWYVHRLREQFSTSFAGVMRQSPSFWEGHSKAQFSVKLSVWWRWGRSWWQKITSPGFVIGLECVIIRRRVRRLPSINWADVHRGPRYRWRFGRLWSLWAVFLIIAIFCRVYYHHCCQDV